MRFPPQLPQTLRATIELPASKSLKNRALLLRALSGEEIEAEPQPLCDDTAVMLRALRDRPSTVDIGAAGTAMRFLAAYFATCPGKTHLLTGSERMRQRPIGALVDALRQLGADIAYAAREGYPPLRIKGLELPGGNIELPADISSQYVSALLMVAPTLRHGLVLRLSGQVVSRPYIDMTLALMRRFGAQAGWADAQTLCVKPVPYVPNADYTVENDWSAASYWYEMVALAPDKEARVELPGLHADSLQGDSVVSRLFAPLGVETTFLADRPAAVLTRTAPADRPGGELYEADLANCPDLAQTLVVTCALLRRPFRFTGLKSLRIKETDRLEALRCELRKFGLCLNIEGSHSLYIKEYPEHLPRYCGLPIATYNDHRMALSFAPAAWMFPDLTIENPEVVSKSYPGFWNDLLSL